MEFAKFASLVTTQALWLSNLSVLASMDPYEGLFPKKNYEHRNWRSESDIPAGKLAIIKGTRYTNKTDETMADKLARVKELGDLRIRQGFAYRKSYYVSCWHASAYESAAMWSIHSTNNAGIAITSSAARMKRSFESTPTALYLGKVKYLDYDVAEIDIGNAFNLVLSKK